MKIVWCILKQNNSQHFKIYFYISDKFIFAQMLTFGCQETPTKFQKTILRNTDLEFKMQIW